MVGMGPGKVRVVDSKLVMHAVEYPVTMVEQWVLKTQVSGSTAVLQAICEHAEKGGSWGVDVALNYYSQWLVRSCGKYPSDVWSKLWTSTGSLTYMLPQVAKAMYQHNAAALFQPSFFEIREAGEFGKFIRTIKPIAQFPNGEVELRFDIGTRGNGVDKAVWPTDLNTDIVV
ncbi:hypothetical protein AJ80_07072 [Polytolypa hystricis UAMH7299]|uniref:Uncharacterized protein n=1 Tax=Polytolypa hystricis (strain UAMH7299) TaxID=1447883 RepID=A0A2B7XSJ5_POLH7|nr:hypothetical protein AJ80_07072 [Polytolypa hystricis UAMH7299]